MWNEVAHVTVSFLLSESVDWLQKRKMISGSRTDEEAEAFSVPWFAFCK